MEPITFFIYAFTSIFIIVNPISGILTFISVTEGMTEAEKMDTARRSVIIACILAIVFAFAGEVILMLFSITVDSLRVAGGILLFLIAIDMLHGRVSRESVTPEEIKDASRREDVSVFPLATPLLTGPGAITTIIVIIRTGKTWELKVITLLAILLTFILSYFILRFADKINKILGITVSLVITRIMGLLLGAIAVDFIATGILNIYKSYFIN
ncbi:MAG: NAAT family transporter [Nitrospirae bacterium]|nr:NAAT family transporter [Nitrospirota bacterium]